VARHGEGRRCGEDARRSECSRRCQGLRATLTRQKGSAGGGCPHRVLERAECDAEGDRRRGRAETDGRRWWRGRKRAVPASWTHGLTPEGAAEADMGSGGPERHRRRAIARRRPHLRRRNSARRGRAWFGSGCAGRGSVRRREGSRGQLKGEAVILGAGRWQASTGDLGGTLRGESGSRQRIARSRLWLLLLEGRSMLRWLAGGATGLRRSTGQRDDPAGRNRVLGEDRGERKVKDLTCRSGWKRVRREHAGDAWVR